MPLIINTNVSSLNAQRHLGINTNSLQKSMEKLASGFRINRAGDDAAGLQVSENLRAQIRGSKKALDNIQDGIGVLNIADGAYQTITDNLQRMRELAVQGANDTYATAQRSAIAQEIDQLLFDITRIANATKFNGVDLLSSSVAAAFTLQVGPNTIAVNDTINIAPALATSTASNILTGVSASTYITSNAGALNFLGAVDTAITTVNARRGMLGAYINRLEGSANNLMINVENLEASESRIRNVDVASESAQLVRNQILQQSSATILAQANQTPSLALKLLGN
jgi:flagellin